MKVVVAIDSFKGSLSSLEAGQAAKEGILRACPGADVIVRPLADGGEGTTEALVNGLGGRFEKIDVTGPMGKAVNARYGILFDGNTAVIEMAEAAGITLIPEIERKPLEATTYGVGEMILDAVKKGCRKFIVGIGGSATIDGGVGMLQALGFAFLDEHGRDIRSGIQDLDRIYSIGSEKVLPVLWECSFQIACDVKNPLCGGSGAIYVYGPQKGVREVEKKELDEKMAHYARVTAAFTGTDNSQAAGAGAAGGMGFAFLSYLPGAELKSGISIAIQAVSLEEDIREADIVVTGEGCLDGQTAMGKVPVGVAETAKKYEKRVIAFAGEVTQEAGECNKKGIDAFFPIVRGVSSLEEAMNPIIAKRNMASAAEQVFRLL